MKYADDYGNKYYKSKKTALGGIFKNIKLNPSDWYLGCHTIDKIPEKRSKHFGKKTFENQTGTNNGFKPLELEK